MDRRKASSQAHRPLPDTFLALITNRLHQIFSKITHTSIAQGKIIVAYDFYHIQVKRSHAKCKTPKLGLFIAISQCLNNEISAFLQFLCHPHSNFGQKSQKCHGWCKIGIQVTAFLASFKNTHCLYRLEIFNYLGSMFNIIK